MLEEEVHHPLVSAFGSAVERSVPDPRVSVHVRAAADQQRRQLGLAHSHRDEKRCLAAVVAGVHIGPVVHQRLGSRDVALPYGVVQILSLGPSPGGQGRCDYDIE
jgi:hypothetical protein